MENILVNEWLVNGAIGGTDSDGQVWRAGGARSRTHRPNELSMEELARYHLRPE